MAATGALKKKLQMIQEKLRPASVMEKGEEITGVMEEVFVGGIL